MKCARPDCNAEAYGAVCEPHEVDTWCSTDTLPCGVCAWCISQLEPDKPTNSFDTPWTPTAEDERIALLFPSLSFLALMHPDDRAWFTKGERGRWFREEHMGSALTPWAWRRLGGEV